MCRWRTPVALLLAVAALLATAATSASAHAAGAMPLVAHGSVEQAYATGLAPHGAATLLRHGARVQTRRADGQGGVLFRGVAAGRRLPDPRRRAQIRPVDGNDRPRRAAQHEARTTSRSPRSPARVS